METVTIPCLKDNYAYLLIDTKTRQAAAIDPVEPDKVLKAANENQCRLKMILTTHHHWDHAGGNEQLKSQLSDLQIYGADDRIAALTDKIGDSDIIKLGEQKIHVMLTNCHTAHSVSYYCPSIPAVFTGDTLFLGGCGRFFEGTASDMYNALINKLGKLPKETKVYCGHEYTEANLRFAQSVDPDNEDLNAEVKRLKSISVPGTIGTELLVNPFMRVDYPYMKTRLNATDGVHAMQILRELKNNF